jgi:hypothetical protein
MIREGLRDFDYINDSMNQGHGGYFLSFSFISNADAVAQYIVNYRADILWNNITSAFDKRITLRCKR